MGEGKYFYHSLCWTQQTPPCLPFSGEVWSGLGANLSFLCWSVQVYELWLVSVCLLPCAAALPQWLFPATLSTEMLLWIWLLIYKQAHRSKLNAVSGQLLLPSCCKYSCLCALIRATVALKTSIMCHPPHCLFFSSKASLEKNYKMTKKICVSVFFLSSPF